MLFRKFPPLVPSNRSSFKRVNEKPFDMQIIEENALKTIRSLNPSLLLPLSMQDGSGSSKEKADSGDDKQSSLLVTIPQGGDIWAKNVPTVQKQSKSKVVDNQNGLADELKDFSSFSYHQSRLNQPPIDKIYTSSPGKSTPSRSAKPPSKVSSEASFIITESNQDSLY